MQKESKERLKPQASREKYKVSLGFFRVEKLLRTRMFLPGGLWPGANTYAPR